MAAETQHALHAPRVLRARLSPQSLNVTERYPVFAGLMVTSVGQIKFSGSFSKTAAPSGGYVTSDTITLTVPGGNSGQIDLAGGIVVGTIGAVQYSKNGAAFTEWLGTVTFANGDTVRIRAGGGGGSGMTSGESIEFTLTDVTRNIVSSIYTLAAP